MLLSKNRTLTEGVSYINNGPLGYPVAIRISKNGGRKHFVVRLTAIVTPLVILMSYSSIQMQVEEGSQFRQVFEEVSGERIASFGNAGEI